MALRTPLMVVNLKTYPQGHGEAGFALCREMAAVAEASGACLAAATSALDLRRFAHKGGVPVLAQHIDAAPAGAHTGAVLPEAAVAAGAVGTLVNHAERQLDWATIETTLARAREAGMLSQGHQGQHGGAMTDRAEQLLASRQRKRKTKKR